MKLQKSKLLMIFLCFLFAAAWFSMTCESFADTCDGSGNCDISGEYQIDSGTMLRKVNESMTIACNPPDLNFNYLLVGFNNLANYPTNITDPRINWCGSPQGNGSRFENVFVGYNIANLVGSIQGKEDQLGRYGTYIGSSVFQQAPILANGDTIIGANAGSHAYTDVIIGEGSYGYNTVIGARAGQFLKGGFNVMIGNEAGAMLEGESNIVIGNNALYGLYQRRTGHFNIHLGYYTDTEDEDTSDTIVMGIKSRATESNQMVIGSKLWYDGNQLVHECYGPNCESQPYGNIKESYWGAGVRAQWADEFDANGNPGQDGVPDPIPFIFNATGGLGDDMPGADLIIAGGKSTGSEDGGHIIFKTAPSGSSGSVQNVLQNRMTINSDGNIMIGDGSTATTQYTPSLIFDGRDSDCEIFYDSENGWFKTPCMFNIGGMNFGGNQQRIQSVVAGQLEIKARDEIIIDTKNGTDIGTVNITTSNVLIPDGKVGIGTASPLSKLAAIGLPTTAPVSGTSHIVCIDPGGNFWVDDDGVNDCE